MKKLIFLLLSFLLFTTIQAADFDLSVSNVSNDRATIHIPRSGSGGGMFSVYVNGEPDFNTAWNNSKIDSETITTTVKFNNKAGLLPFNYATKPLHIFNNLVSKICVFRSDVLTYVIGKSFFRYCKPLPGLLRCCDFSIHLNFN